MNLLAIAVEYPVNCRPRALRAAVKERFFNGNVLIWSVAGPTFLGPAETGRDRRRSVKKP
jgi:hypothetical protein